MKYCQKMKSTGYCNYVKINIDDQLTFYTTWHHKRYQVTQISLRFSNNACMCTWVYFEVDFKLEDIVSTVGSSLHHDNYLFIATSTKDDCRNCAKMKSYWERVDYFERRTEIIGLTWVWLYSHLKITAKNINTLKDCSFEKLIKIN